MPLYEYECLKCGAVSSFIEKIDDWRFWRRRCGRCGSFKLRKLMSTFSAHVTRSGAEMVEKLRQYGPVSFVPQAPRPLGPPPGGCPYAQPEKKTPEKK